MENDSAPQIETITHIISGQNPRHQPVCAAASQTLCLFVYSVNLFLFPFKDIFFFFSPVSIQINLSVAPYWQNQADGALIAAKRPTKYKTWKYILLDEAEPAIIH